MQAGSLARRYARAIMDLAVAAGNVDKVAADLHGLAATYKVSPELAEVLGNASYPKAKRRAIVDALLTKLGAQPLTKTFSNLVLDNERLAAIPDIARELAAMVEAKAGRVAAEVVSATPLTPAQVTQLTTTLEKLSGKKVVLSRREDPELLGGVVAKVGDVVYDGSLRTQLRVLRDELSR